MSEKDEKELDIPNFGGVDVTEEHNEKEQNIPLKVDKNAKAKAELEAKIKAEADAKAKLEAEKEAKTKAEAEAKETAEKLEAEKKAEEAKAKAQAKIDEEKKAAVIKDKTSSKSKPTQKGKQANSATVKPKGKRKPNYLVIATLVVIAIPCFVLLYIIIGSHENKGEPVIGDRFDNALDPAITETELNDIKGALQFDTAEKVTVNLKSATLRITIDTKDELSQDEIEAIMNDTYGIVTDKLAVDTYFTNKKSGDTTIKMYDLEVNVYNFIPENDEDKENQIHVSRTKNSAAESDNVDILSTPKNADTSDKILNPDTTTPPSEEGNAEGE